jgi:hypothetical protein
MWRKFLSFSAPAKGQNFFQQWVHEKRLAQVTDFCLL